MRSGVIAGLVWLAAVAAAEPVRADDPPQNPSQEAHRACEVPNTFLATESRLPKVADAVKAGRPLDILVIGSRSSTIPGSEASAYPARLQASLKDTLPQITVNIALEIHPKKTAEEMAGALVKLMEAKKPTLVIWQTGTVDALRSVDPDDFRNAVDEGVVALQNAGTDVI